MNKVKKPLMLLLATLALGASGCESSNITVKEKVELIDPIEPESGPLNPITDEIRALAATKAPEVDPSTVISTKRSEYDFHSQSYIDIDLQSGDLSIREGHSLIYLFRGSYKEGYQGDYYCYYASIYLWDDGFVTGISNTEPFKGYWYNDENGDGIVTDADRLGIICDSDTYQKYSNIIFEKGEFFYDWRGQIYLNTGTADRSIDIGGYLYYETIAIAIESNKTGTRFKVGDSFDIKMWAVFEIHQDLRYTYAFEREDIESMQVKWIIPEGLIVEDKVVKSGTYIIKATYDNFEAKATIVVQ